MMLFAQDIPVVSSAVSWPQVAMTLLAMLPGLIAALAAAWVSILKAKQLEKKIDENTEVTKTSIDETRQKVDSSLEKAAESLEKAAEQSMTNAKQEAVKVAAVAMHEQSKKLDEIKQQVNGRMDELLRAAEERGYARGLADGRKGT